MLSFIFILVEASWYGSYKEAPRHYSDVEVMPEEKNNKILRDYYTFYFYIYDCTCCL